MHNIFYIYFLYLNIHIKIEVKIQYRGKTMDKKKFILPILIATSFVVSACSGGFNKYIDIVVTNVSNPTEAEANWTYEEVYRSKVNIFNSAILPDNPSANWPTGKSFLGYGVNDFVKGVSKKKDFYASKGLVRYNDVKKYAVNNTVTLKAAYCNPEDIPTKYLVVGWYARTKTSGLTTDIMDEFETMLMNHMKEIGTSKEDLLDVEVRAYDGDVATIGGDITFDGDVDIFLGAGVNLGSQGGVEYVQRNAYDIAGVADRYIYRLSDRDQVVEAYTWMRSKEVKNFFK